MGLLACLKALFGFGQCPQTAPTPTCAPRPCETPARTVTPQTDEALEAISLSPLKHAPDAQACSFVPARKEPDATFGGRALTPAESALLRAADGNEPSALYISAAWLEREHVDLERTFSAFLNDGLLEARFERERLTVAELRALAKHFELKVGGRKAELVKRLAEHADDELAAQCEKRVLRLTERGRAALSA